MTTDPTVRRLAWRFALAAALVFAALAPGSGCFGGQPPVGPPALHKDSCAACRANCRWRGNLCQASSRSETACALEGADCETRCMKRYCQDHN